METHLDGAGLFFTLGCEYFSYRYHLKKNSFFSYHCTKTSVLMDLTSMWDFITSMSGVKGIYSSESIKGASIFFRQFSSYFSGRYAGNLFYASILHFTFYYLDEAGITCYSLLQIYC